MAEETGGTKWDASVLNPLERFFERVHNEPEHAAYLSKKQARDMTDSLGNHNGRRFSVGHGREVASLRHREKRKVPERRMEARAPRARSSARKLVRRRGAPPSIG